MREADLRQNGNIEFRRSVMAGMICLGAAATGVAIGWGFTVDDALISARLAHNIAAGHGYRFNPSGSLVDAVTPLGWAYVLAPFAKRGPLAALMAARIIGVLAWLASAAWLGVAVARCRAAIWPLSLFAILAPVGLWASSGMETGVVTALVTCATASGRLGILCLGIAAAWRPELIPFAFALTAARSQSARDAGRNLCVVFALPTLVMLTRWVTFGTPQPLAAVAKPSDWTHGFWYSLEALLWTGPFWLWLSRGWPGNAVGRAPNRNGSRVVIRWIEQLPGWPWPKCHETALAVAVLVHFGGVALAGGDWMPAYRLVVPVLPAMVRLACHVPKARGRVLRVLGLGLAIISMLTIDVKLVPSARRIVEQRTRLIRGAAKSLESAHVVAAPDVGWVGAAFPHDIVDLAGATDPVIANLRGGHTSKRVESRLFVSRNVDRIIVLMAPRSSLAASWVESRFARAIDQRTAMLAADLGCQPADLLAIPFTEQRYLVLRCPVQ